MIHLITPVSLLTSFSKIFEKVIYNRLYHHIKNNHILINEQFCFRHATSTDIASYKFPKNILTALNNKQLVRGIFCDLHKTFDCINHDILLSKMECYGISGKANNLIKSYLQDRYHSIGRPCFKKKITPNGNLLQMELPRDPYLFPPPLFFFYILTLSMPN